MDRVRIFDTTLRDGEQTPGVALTSDDKMEIARHQARLGVDIIEAGFPITSQGEFEAVRRIASEIDGPVIAALARTHPRDIERAWEAVSPSAKPRIHVFISTSDIHLQHMMRMDRARALELTTESVTNARSLCDDIEFSAQDATRTDINYLAEVVHAAIEAGATTINLPDTVGYATPWTYAGMFEEVMRQVPTDGVIFSTHTHDDLGMAVANALAAVQAGARQVECTINGIGERAGNCSLEEVVMALKVRADAIGPATGVEATEIGPASETVARLTGIAVPPNKAVVGAHAFAHESGIHQDGFLKDPSTYEIMRPHHVGRGDSRLVMGKHSGRHAFRLHLQERGYELSDDQFIEVFNRFKELADRRETVDDRGLAQLVEAVQSTASGA